MEATRYRLRFITGVALSAATYGSATYGAGTYGEQASDAVTALRYVVMPFPGGSLSTPSWLYRQGDTEPDLRLGIAADDGFLNYTGLATARLVLNNTDGAISMAPLVYELAVTRIDGKDWLTRAWLNTDLLIPGTFRAAVVLEYSSGRRLTLPFDDRHNFVITPNSALDSSAQMWEQARWDFAKWSEDTS